MIIQSPRLFDDLVSGRVTASQLEPWFNGDFAKQQNADITAQARRRNPSNRVDQRSSITGLP